MGSFRRCWHSRVIQALGENEATPPSFPKPYAAPEIPDTICKSQVLAWHEGEGTTEGHLT